MKTENQQIDGEITSTSTTSTASLTSTSSTTTANLRRIGSVLVATIGDIVLWAGMCCFGWVCILANNDAADMLALRPHLFGVQAIVTLLVLGGVLTLTSQLLHWFKSKPTKQ